MLNLAILGAGAIAKVMAATVNAMNQNGNHEVKLYAVGSRNLQKAKDFAKTYGIPKAYGSYEDLVKDSQVDFVYVATPHNFHLPHAKLCLEHGRHVLVEKAFTANAKEAKELLSFAKEKKLLATEAIWTRYQPMRGMINSEVASGIVGTPVMVTANLSYSMAHKERLMKPELCGGALLDVGVYALNFALMVLGHPDGVDAVCQKNALGVDVNDSITLTYNSGKMAVLCSSSLAVSDRFGMIHCTDGYICVDNINNPQWYKVLAKDYSVIKEVKCPEQFTGYEYEVEQTARAINLGLLECQAMPHDETLYVMRLMDSIRAQFGVKYPFE